MKTRSSAAIYTAIFALGLISLPAVAANVTESVKQSCKGDYQRYCKAYKIGTEALRACMSRSIKKVSNVCVSALVGAGEISKAQADRLKQQKAQTTKRTPTKKRTVKTSSRKKR